MNRSYEELMNLPLQTFEERYDYLKLGGVVGDATVGIDRYINQIFYRTPEWRKLRSTIIMRDQSCDLGVPGLEIYTGLTVHHINPITVEDIEARNFCIFDPNNLIVTSRNTHQAIHYSNDALLITAPKERRKGDTQLWKAYSRL